MLWREECNRKQAIPLRTIALFCLKRFTVLFFVALFPIFRKEPFCSERGIVLSVPYTRVSWRRIHDFHQSSIAQPGRC